MDDLLQAAEVLNDNEIVYLQQNNLMTVQLSTYVININSQNTRIVRTNLNKKANCQPVFIVNFDY